MKRRDERGSVLVMVMIIVFTLASLGAALTLVSFAGNKSSLSANEWIRGRYAAEAVLERALVEIDKSVPTSTGNPWLIANAIPYPGGGYTAKQLADLPFRAHEQYRMTAFTVPGFRPMLVEGLTGGAYSPPTFLYVYSLDPTNKNYRIISQAVTTSVSGKENKVTIAQEIKARDTFARWTAFVNAQSMHFGGSTVRGKVHSNQRIYFHYGGATFHDDVTAHTGFSYADGANTSNTSFLGAANGGAAQINMPAATDIDTRRTYASGMYDLDASNPMWGLAAPDAVDAKITFKGATVEIQAYSKTTGLPAGPLQSGPLPPDGVIFVQGDVLAIEGRVQGAVTVATSNSITVTGPIVYEDSGGDSRYVLQKNGTDVAQTTLANGNKIYTDSNSWTAGAGYQYIENPSYNAPATPPSVGLMAKKQVVIADAAPYNMELHAAIFSLEENWSADLTSQKGNFRFLGSLASNKAGFRAQGDYGYGKSGELIYDMNFVDTPPSRWLEVPNNFWGPRFSMTDTSGF
jgi:hypothetical protein